MKIKLFNTNLLPLACLGLLFTFGCDKQDLAPADQPAAQNNGDNNTSDSPSFIRHAHRYIIISAGNNLPANLAAEATAANGTVTASFENMGLATATSTDPEFATKVARLSGVRSVIHDFSYQGYDPSQLRAIDVTEDEATASAPATPNANRFFGLLWGLEAIQAPQAWATGARGQGVRVAVLDGGFDLRHPDLAANVLTSASFVPGEPAQFRRTGLSHGSHVAGTIAAIDNSIGVVGVAPEAQLILVKVLRDAGSGSFSWMIDGINYAVQQQADVINMSLGAAIPRSSRYLDDNGTPDDPSDDQLVSETREIQELLVAISKATGYATQQGVTVIASAGNDANNGNQDRNLVHIPSSSTGVISISATGPMGWALNTSTSLDRMASYSNYGTAEIGFAAPGGDFAYTGREVVTFRGVRQVAWALDMVLSTSSNGGYTWSAGTSMASPHATGVAALIIGKNGGQMSPAHVQAALRASADDLGQPGRDPYYGHGRVNALRAVTAAQ